jgi:hypothetical protein
MSFQIEDRGNGTKWVEIDNHRLHMHEIAHWCKLHQCGKQVNIRAISFKNDEELTMFLLRWQSQLQ